MAASDKVLEALKYARRIETVKKLQFDSENVATGAFVTIGGVRVLEFDSLGEANKASSELNRTLDPRRQSVIADLETKIQSILDA